MHPSALLVKLMAKLKIERERERDRKQGEEIEEKPERDIRGSICEFRFHFRRESLRERRKSV